MKHTLGPWMVFDSDVSGLSVNSVGECKRVCEMPHNPRKEDRDNALLIAAAPDMYETLNACLLREDIAEGELGDLIRSVLAKAEGPSS